MRSDKRSAIIERAQKRRADFITSPIRRRPAVLFFALWVPLMLLAAHLVFPAEPVANEAELATALAD